MEILFYLLLMFGSLALGFYIGNNATREVYAADMEAILINVCEKYSLDKTGVADYIKEDAKKILATSNAILKLKDK
jgi:hypothetical protein